MATAKLPRSLDVIRKAWDVQAKHYKAFYKLLWPIVALIGGAIVLIMIGDSGDPVASSTVVLQGAGGVLYVAGIIYSIWATLVLIRMIYQALSGKINDKEAKKDIWRAFWPYLGVSILVGLLTGIGFLLFIIPGIIVSLMYFTAQYEVIIAGKGVFASMAESKKQTKGRKWNLFATLFWAYLWPSLGVMALYVIIGILAALIISSDVIGPAVMGVLMTTLEMALLPFFMALSIELYRHLKKA